MYTLPTFHFQVDINDGIVRLISIKIAEWSRIITCFVNEFVEAGCSDKVTSKIWEELDDLTYMLGWLLHRTMANKKHSPGYVMTLLQLRDIVLDNQDLTLKTRHENIPKYYFGKNILQSIPISVNLDWHVSFGWGKLCDN